ncbi:MAG: hypothetical protein JWM05_363, partial [Acidimicrobiales bacterium]|nr:hypothetical protein [Acidimicrobiales bacterium]
GLATPTAQAGSTPASDLAGIASGTLDDGTGVNVADATAGEGMGEYAYDPSTLGLSVPRSAYAGAYSSTVTLTITQKVAP